MNSKDIVNTVARTAFNKVNTSISIAIATQVSDSLSKYVDRYNIVLVSIVVYSCLSLLSGIIHYEQRTFSTAKSLIGIVGTTTIMRQISDVGNELVPGSPDATSSPSYSGMSTSPSSPSMPSVVLGTCFVMISGCFQSISREATAIRMGVRYAYSDILMAAVPDKPVKMAISLILLLLIPISHGWVNKMKSIQPTGPLPAILSALTLVGVSFIIDCAMPMDTNLNLVEDLVRGTSAVLLMDGFTKSVPSLGEEIGPYASWIVARKFSVLLGEYGGMLEMLACVGVLTGIAESLRGVFKGNVVVVMRDLLVLVAAFLLAGWMMGSVNTSNGGDAGIVLVSTLFIIRMVFAIMGDV